MNKEERLKKEVKELLSGDKLPIIIDKNVVYDKRASQFTIRIPKEVVNSARLNKNSQFRIVVNPDDQEFEKMVRSHIIIYGKEKEEK